MDELDEMVLRKRRDRLYNRTSAPIAFLTENMFQYQAPPPIPGAAQPAYAGMPTQQPQSAEAPYTAQVTRSNVEELRKNMQWSGSGTANRADNYKDKAVESRAAALAAARSKTVAPAAASGKTVTAAPQTVGRNPDDVADHNERSKRQGDGHFNVVGTASSVGYDTRR
jgi:hypothetical protein